MTKEKKGQSKADKHTHCTGKQTYTLTLKKKEKENNVISSQMSWREVNIPGTQIMHFKNENSPVTNI